MSAPVWNTNIIEQGDFKETQSTFQAMKNPSFIVYDSAFYDVSISFSSQLAQGGL